MSDILTLVDKAKLRTYESKYSAFLAPILCKLKVVITSTETETCATDGIHLYVNEQFFTELTMDQRITVLLHESWHVARLHMLRQGNRDNTLWNIACDYRINNDLQKEGYNIESINGLINYNFDNPNLSEEEIYEKLKQYSNQLPKQMLGGDIKDPSNSPLNEGEDSSRDSSSVRSEIIGTVVEASQIARMSDPGAIPGDASTIINTFLKPVLPWEKLLENFFNDMIKEDYSWKRPNKRFTDIYMPAINEEEGRLEHLAFFMDTSASISDDQLKRFNSEVKYIQETYQPKKLTIIQFDTRIHSIQTYNEEQKFKSISCEGRGGTDLSEVHAYIVKNKPTASVIFTDLWCSMMPKVKSPVIWVISGDHEDAPFGKNIHIKE